MGDPTRMVFQAAEIYLQNIEEVNRRVLREGISDETGTRKTEPGKPATLADQVEAVLKDFSPEFRTDRARQLVAEILNANKIRPDLLEAIMLRFRAEPGGNLAVQLAQLKNVIDSNVPGVDSLLAQLGHPHFNIYKGARWVVRYLSETGLWSKVEKLEESAEAGGRRWDARIGRTLFQFKSWESWDGRNEATFLRQIEQDYGFTEQLRRPLRWVFEGGKLGSAAKIIELMRVALARSDLPVRTKEAISAALPSIVSVGTGR